MTGQYPSHSASDDIGGAYSDAKGRSRLSQLVSLAAYKFQNSRHFADVKYRSFVRIRTALREKLDRPLRGLALLEVGCGQWMANVKLFSAMGNTVFAVDPELPPRSLFGYPDFIRQCGWQRGIKTGLNELLFRRRFDRRLEQLAGLRFGPAGDRLFRVQGEALPIADESVDAVFSDNVFEHIADVRAVTAEVRRVLKPGGVAYIIVHPFAAWSGGHHLDIMVHSGDKRAAGNTRIPPWDHLRENRVPSGVYLNRLREADYRAIFTAVFPDLEEETVGPEGEEHLSRDIEAELAERGFTRRELLTSKLVYTGRKR